MNGYYMKYGYIKQYSFEGLIKIIVIMIMMLLMIQLRWYSSLWDASFLTQWEKKSPPSGTFPLILLLIRERCLTVPECPLCSGTIRCGDMCASSVDSFSIQAETCQPLLMQGRPDEFMFGIFSSKDESISVFHLPTQNF